MPASRSLLISILAFLLPASAVAEPAAEAPTFTLADATGAKQTLPAEQDGVGVYLFWATWCPYCKALMPHLQSVVDEYGDRVTVYALNFRDDNDPRGFMTEKGFDFTLFPDADMVARDWGARATPALYIVDDQGHIRFDLYNVITEDPPGFDEMTHTQRAARPAPLWAARIRAALDEVLAAD